MELVIILTVLCTLAFVATIGLAVFAVRRYIDNKINAVKPDIEAEAKRAADEYFKRRANQFIPKDAVPREILANLLNSGKIDSDERRDDDLLNNPEKLEKLRASIAEGNFTTNDTIGGIPDNPLDQLRFIDERQQEINSASE